MLVAAAEGVVDGASGPGMGKMVVGMASAEEVEAEGTADEAGALGPGIGEIVVGADVATEEATGSAEFEAVDDAGVTGTDADVAGAEVAGAEEDGADSVGPVAAGCSPSLAN